MKLTCDTEAGFICMPSTESNTAACDLSQWSNFHLEISLTFSWFDQSAKRRRQVESDGTRLPRQLGGGKENFLHQHAGSIRGSPFLGTASKLSLMPKPNCIASRSRMRFSLSKTIVENRLRSAETMWSTRRALLRCARLLGCAGCMTLPVAENAMSWLADAVNPSRPSCFQDWVAGRRQSYRPR
jgi:hypothetical protein